MIMILFSDCHDGGESPVRVRKKVQCDVTGVRLTVFHY